MHLFFLLLSLGWFCEIVSCFSASVTHPHGRSYIVEHAGDIESSDYNHLIDIVKHDIDTDSDFHSDSDIGDIVDAEDPASCSRFLSPAVIDALDAISTQGVNIFKTTGNIDTNIETNTNVKNDDEQDYLEYYKIISRALKQIRKLKVFASDSDTLLSPSRLPCHNCSLSLLSAVTSFCSQIDALVRAHRLSELHYTAALTFALPKTTTRLVTQVLTRLRCQNALKRWKRRERGQRETVTPRINPAHFSVDALLSARRAFADNNYVLYQEDFFDQDTHAAIVSAVNSLWRANQSALIEANCNLDGINRIGGYVHISSSHSSSSSSSPSSSPSLYSLIGANDEFLRWFYFITRRHYWIADFPIELREYGRHSGGMGCHVDTHLYGHTNIDAPHGGYHLHSGQHGSGQRVLTPAERGIDVHAAVEMVYTVSHSDDSRCTFTFVNSTGHVVVVRPRANSLSLVRPDASLHCVTGTDGGTREILKFIMVTTYDKSPQFKWYIHNVCVDGETCATFRQLELARQPYTFYYQNQGSDKQPRSPSVHAKNKDNAHKSNEHVCTLDVYQPRYHKRWR